MKSTTSQIKKNIRTLTGTVVSDAMDKTVVIEVKSTKRHDLYQKQYATSARYMAHDEDNTYKVGDVVTLRPARPCSRKKRWYVASKLSD